VARLVFRYQAYLFFPLLLGEAVSLHVASVRALTRRASHGRSWERALITIHAVGYLAAVFLVLSPVKSLATGGAGAARRETPGRAARRGARRASARRDRWHHGSSPGTGL
jgi:hypothetical protein